MMAVATLIGIRIDFLGINPIKALFWTAVINGFLAPPVLAVIMRIANDRRVMGDAVNSRVYSPSPPPASPPNSSGADLAGRRAVNLAAKRVHRILTGRVTRLQTLSRVRSSNSE